MKENRLHELRKLLKTPDYDFILDGEIYRFVSDDPLEERVQRIPLPAHEDVT